MTGEQLAKARKAAGLTQKALGLALGYKESTAEKAVQQWEYGRPIPIKHYRKLAEILHLTLEDMLP